MKKMIEIGFCDKAHGIKGGFVFKLYHPETSILKNGVKIWLFPKDVKSQLKNEGQIYQIEKISFGNKVICYLKDVGERSHVDLLLPFSIQIPRDEFPKINNDDEYYVTDLLGLNVFDYQSKKRIGKVLDYYENNGQIVFIIDNQGEKIDIPFRKTFFPFINVKEGRIEVNLPILVED